MGPPPPLDPAAARFRTVTGVTNDYRAWVAFVGAEAAVFSLRRNVADPVGGFRSGPVYRTDLVTLDPRASPINIKPRSVQLTASACFVVE